MLDLECNSLPVLNMAIFRFNKHDKYALHDLETIDDDLDREGVVLVRLADEDGHLADKYKVTTDQKLD